MKKIIYFESVSRLPRGHTRRIFALIAAGLLVLLLTLSALGVSDYNCDAGKHKYVETGRILATPTKDGAVLYRCELCGKDWEDILFATDHIWGSWIIDKEATCTQPGERHRTCSRGASHVQYEQTAALGHNYKESITVQPGCETAGTKTIECLRCGDSEAEPVPALGHKYIESITREPSCLENGEKSFTCSNDPAHTYTEQTESYGGHDFGEWFVEKAAKEGVAGVEARICSRDESHKETKEIPALVPEEEEPFFNSGDIVIGSVNVGLTGTFSVMIHPYVKWSKYIRKRRRYVEQINGLREAVAKHYDFK